MLDTLFKGLFETSTTATISVGDFLLCIIVSLCIGLFLALTYTFRSRYTKSFVVTLAILPAVVCVVIMMVNGNVGAGVAVAGAFSLVRFRSAPGTAREIGTIFLAMGAGLIAGMGYLGFAILFALVLGLCMVLYTQLGFGNSHKVCPDKTLRITIPEDLNYSEVFTDLMEQYTKHYELVKVKTTNLGSLFKLTYNITLMDVTKEKEFIDQLRCRNGNLEISIMKQEINSMEL
ncbi:MAG: DUF4956 domain-containing protein [Agathobacter sp.]|nr:DUF4956 domain-containing protein [Agathobacter sp.]